MTKSKAKSGGPTPRSVNNNKKTGSAVHNALSKIPRGTLATIGAMLGGPPGRLIGQGISSISGYGDYTVNSNSIQKEAVLGNENDPVPHFTTRDGGMIVKHRELIGNVVVPASPTAFDGNTYDLNVANDAMFPWLSGIARHYQRYRIRGMVIAYKSTSTDYNNSGVVAITTQYDPMAPDFQSMVGLLNSKFAVSTKPSKNILAPVECDEDTMPRAGLIVDRNTSRLTSAGIVTVATEGLSLAAGEVLGQLWVTYDIEFYHPNAQIERLGGSGFSNEVALNFNNGTGTTYAEDATVETVIGSRFVEIGTVPTSTHTEILVQGTYTDFWQIRPSVQFLTGGRYIVEFTQTAIAADGITWVGISTAGEIQGDIIFTRDVLDIRNSTTGLYKVWYHVDVPPGAVLRPYANTSTAGTLPVRLSVTKL